MSLEIVPVTPDRWDAYASFFGHHKPQCYCRWPRLAPMTFTPDDPTNREAMRELIASGACPGLLACRDGVAVGWCAVARQDEYPQYATPESDAWGIACITVSSEARGVGIGKELVRAAVRYAAAAGAASIEGPPPWWNPRDDSQRAATIRALVSNGFEEVGEGARMPIFRRKLRE